MKLLKSMRDQITRRVIDEIRLPRETALRRREEALAIRLLRRRYGDDVFERCRALPEGWLHVQKTFSIEYHLAQQLPSQRTAGGYRRHRQNISLSEYTPLPSNVSSGWDSDTVGPGLVAELHDLFAAFADLAEELHNLKVQVTAVLGAFTTVEKLADGWPEGYVHLPAEMLAQTGGVPAPRIADLNARIVKLKEAA